MTAGIESPIYYKGLNTSFHIIASQYALPYNEP